MLMGSIEFRKGGKKECEYLDKGSINVGKS
jgi:hypothetical protein